MRETAARGPVGPESRLWPYNATTIKNTLRSNLKTL